MMNINARCMNKGGWVQTANGSEGGGALKLDKSKQSTRL